jgi:phosphoribosylformimino-5-aminoimidazole carboxamide ribotide isomerase
LIIIPAIDLKDGRCVRLLQGDFGKMTIYSDDPVNIAQLWKNKGAARIHVVDLDGSKNGRPDNRNIIEAIVASVDIPVQIGGGIRDIKTIDSYLSVGVSRCILGTAALKNRDFLFEACRLFPGRIILGIDARGERVAIEGWLEDSEYSALDVAKSFDEIGLDAIVYTDIRRDGMQNGVNIESTEWIARQISTPVIASGGVSGIQDIRKLMEVEQSGIIGVIIGKALYEKSISLEEAIQVAGDARNTSAGQEDPK